MKLTKIIATIGPASDSSEKIIQLIDLGVNVFRFNLKHNDRSWHKEKIKLVKKIADEKGIAIGTLIDLQGPEIRTIVELEFEVERGQKIYVGKGKNNLESFKISAPQIFPHLRVGQKVVIDDGKLRFKIVEKTVSGLILESSSNGLIQDKKTFNVPGVSYPLPVLADKDLEAIKMCRDVKVDFIALSFVRTASDIQYLKKIMQEEKIKARVIAKIETKMAIENLTDLVAASEGVMVARGDLGVELPIEEVPYYQKLIIKLCLERGIPVITATQMLASMTNHPYPTRAEISDVANAVYDQTDSVMLSEESAVGLYPERAVDSMKRTVSFSEMQDYIKDTRTIFSYDILDTEEMLCDTAYNLYLQFRNKKQEVGGFIVFSHTGRTGRKLSRYKPKVPIFLFAPDDFVRGGLTMSFGVVPFIQPKTYEVNQIIRIEDMKDAFEYLVKTKMIDPDKYYILLYGDNWRIEGRVSTIKVIPPQNKSTKT